MVYENKSNTSVSTWSVCQLLNMLFYSRFESLFRLLDNNPLNKKFTNWMVRLVDICQANRRKRKYTLQFSYSTYEVLVHAKPKDIQIKQISGE